MQCAMSTYPQEGRGCPCLPDSGTCRRLAFGHTPEREHPSHSPRAVAVVVFAADDGDTDAVLAGEVVAAAATAAEAAAVAVVAAAAVAASVVVAVATLVTVVAAAVVVVAVVAAVDAAAFRSLDPVLSPIPCLFLFLIA